MEVNQVPVRSRLISTLLVGATFVGLICAAFMMYVAWQHNAQGEIHNEEGIDWVYWLLIGLSWFFVTVAIPYLIALAIFLWQRLIR